MARHAHAGSGSAKSGGGEEKRSPAQAGGAAATGSGDEEKTRPALAFGGAAKTGSEEKARPVQGSGSARTEYEVLELDDRLHVLRQSSPWSLTAGFAERARDLLESLLPGT